MKPRFSAMGRTYGNQGRETFRVPGLGPRVSGSGLQVQVQVPGPEPAPSDPYLAPDGRDPRPENVWPPPIIRSPVSLCCFILSANRQPLPPVLGRAGSPSPPLSRPTSVPHSANGRLGEPSLPRAGNINSKGKPEAGWLAGGSFQVVGILPSVIRHRLSPLLRLRPHPFHKASTPPFWLELPHPLAI